MKRESYQLASRQGDVVRLPDGTLGVIAMQDIVYGGNCKIVTVFPFIADIIGLFRQLFGGHQFCEEEINSLQKIGSIVN